MGYESFFEEKPNSKQTQFVEKLEEQDQQEKIEYIRQIKLQLEGTDDITSAEAKIAFMSIDPGINVEIINKYLSFGLKGEESLPINEFMKNLSLAPVYRVSPLQPGM